MKSVSVKILFAFSLLLIAAAVGPVSAYAINFEAPSEISSGDVFVLSGTSTLPEGFSSEVIVFKKAQVGNKEVGRFPFTINEDQSWSLSIDTNGWDAGTYNLEVQKDSEYSYGGSSDIAFTFTVNAAPEQTAKSTSEVTAPATSEPQNSPQSGPQSQGQVAAQTGTTAPTPATAAKTSPVAVWTALIGMIAAFAAVTVNRR